MSNKKPHPIRNKLHHAVRQGVMFFPRKYLDKKREQKKKGVCYNDLSDHL